jgi:uncharacterized protein (TIGR04255 family)
MPFNLVRWLTSQATIEPLGRIVPPSCHLRWVLDSRRRTKLARLDTSSAAHSSAPTGAHAVTMATDGCADVVTVSESYTRTAGLPRFKSPPVAQVSMGLQFQALPLRAVDLGRLHDTFRARYPVVEEHAAAPPEVEHFGSTPRPMVQFEFLEKPPIPLVAFLSEDRTRLVQVQADRFHCAWRKATEATAYPDYEVIRSDFIGNVELFTAFANSLGAVNIAVTQADIAYVNDIPVETDSQPAALANVLSIINSPAETAGLPEPEDIRVVQRFAFANDAGVECARLHVIAEPFASRETGEVLRLSLVYRGEPHELFSDSSQGLDVMMRFFDEGHDTIVRAFKGVTTPKMHARWEIQP